MLWPISYITVPGRVPFLSFLSLPGTLTKNIMAGRPKKLNRKLEEKILEALSDGLTIRQVFELPGINYTWSSFRKELINSEELMMKYNQAKQLSIDLELSSLKDKRLELEAKIESGELDPKAGQNLVNLFKLTIASSQWSASKIVPKKFGKAAETLSIKSDNLQPLTISWSK